MPLDPETVARATRPVVADEFRKDQYTVSVIAVEDTGDVWVWYEHDKVLDTDVLSRSMYADRARAALQGGWTFHPSQEVRQP
jgi:hypothetical protein